MVRCDLLDVIDRILRVYGKERSKPFGGVQVVLIGDPFQLPPIAKDNELLILKKFYSNISFLNAKVILENPPTEIELKKIYRQKDKEFIELLNRVRINQVTQEDISIFNKRYNSSLSQKDSPNYITITIHNDNATAINFQKLYEISSELKCYAAEITGEFGKDWMPTEMVLELKEGSQIMFVKNNKFLGFHNGEIAKLITIKDNTLIVGLLDNQEIEIGKETWSNIKFTWNEKEKKVEEEVIGTFTQFPVRLAWCEV